MSNGAKTRTHEVSTEQKPSSREVLLEPLMRKIMPVLAEKHKLEISDVIFANILAVLVVKNPKQR